MDSQRIVELGATGFELAGVAVLIIGTLVALVRCAAAIVQRQAGVKTYRGLREGLGRAIMLGLEFLVAADIIRSVALEPSFQTVGVLGLIVLVRTFLSWSIEVEIEGEWPWQRARSRAVSASSEDGGEL